MYKPYSFWKALVQWVSTKPSYGNSLQQKWLLTSGSSGIWMTLLKNSISLALSNNCLRLQEKKQLKTTETMNHQKWSVFAVQHRRPTSWRGHESAPCVPEEHLVQCLPVEESGSFKRPFDTVIFEGIEIEKKKSDFLPHVSVTWTSGGQRSGTGSWSPVWGGWEESVYTDPLELWIWLRWHPFDAKLTQHAEFLINVTYCFHISRLLLNSAEKIEK